jgi:phosphoribosyl-ATP pyrophosphohydrolase
MNNYLLELAENINSKKKGDIKKSYTAFLLSGGFEKCLEKFSEEVKEFKEAIEDNSNIVHESADVIYHFLVTLESRGIKFSDVVRELENRKNLSGYEEKKNRDK